MLELTVDRSTHAERIRQLMANWSANTLELAAELAKAAETFPVNPKRPDERPGFSKWAVQQTGLTRNYVSALLQIHHKFGGGGGGHHRLAGNVMRLLSFQHVPESARIEAISRSQQGEVVGRDTVKKIVAKHKLPTPKAANQQAKEEGRPVLASDNFIYFGTDPDKAKEGEDRRTMVYGVRKALDVLGNIKLTGRQFLSYALPHQLWSDEEAKIIKQSLRWLTSLDAAWEARGD
jgi:hypothetical protein